MTLFFLFQKVEFFSNIIIIIFNFQDNILSLESDDV